MAGHWALGSLGCLPPMCGCWLAFVSNPWNLWVLPNLAKGVNELWTREEVLVLDYSGGPWCSRMCLYMRETERTVRQTHGGQGSRKGQYGHRSRNARCHQKAAEARKQLPPRASTGGWACPHLRFRLLPFGGAREFISVVLSHHELVVICCSGATQVLVQTVILWKSKVKTWLRLWHHHCLIWVNYMNSLNS